MEGLSHEKEIFEYVKTIERLKKQNEKSGLFNKEIKQFEEKVEKLKKQVYSSLTPWQKVQISRHPDRPHALDYIRNITTRFMELSGDRLYADDPALIGGFAEIGDFRFVLVGQEKGNNTETRMHRNFGMMQPEGFRKALRLFKMAEKFSLPIVSFIDTPGAYPGLEAEERGQGLAIAKNLQEMSQLKTPIISIVIGEGCSGGALGIGIADIIGMLEHAYYAVISPEGCASILWKDPSKNIEAASALKLTAEDLLNQEMIDAIIKEPLGGAHQDPKETYAAVKSFILEQASHLLRLPLDTLLEQRYWKFRKIGSFSRS